MPSSALPEAKDFIAKGLQALQVSPETEAKIRSIAQEILGPGATASGMPNLDDLSSALIKVVLAKYPILAGLGVGDLTADLLKHGMQLALQDSGKPDLAALADVAKHADAVDWIISKFQICGMKDANPKAAGGKIDPIPGKRVIRVFVEEDSNKNPLLPNVSDPGASVVELLFKGFKKWSEPLKASIVQTGNLDDANLVVTCEAFTGKDKSILALTDIGPPGGLSGGEPRRMRMIFDGRQTFSRVDFIATAAHEFGHAIGISHADVIGSRQLMSPYLSDITTPQTGDIEAAKRKGWT